MIILERHILQSREYVQFVLPERSHNIWQMTCISRYWKVILEICLHLQYHLQLVLSK